MLEEVRGVGSASRIFFLRVIFGKVGEGSRGSWGADLRQKHYTLSYVKEIKQASHVFLLHLVFPFIFPLPFFIQV